MSLRPGIGANFMHDVASTLMSFNLEQSQADVPSALRHGSRTLPLGRYLRRRLRLLTGKQENASEEILQSLAEEMRPLLEAAKSDPDNPSLRSQIVKKSRQTVLNMSAKNLLKRKKDVL